MPEFHITVDGPVGDVGYFNLDAFTRGYIEALFFTETNDLYDSEDWNTPEAQDDIAEGRCSGSIPSDCGFSDLDSDTLATIIFECAGFQRVHAELLAAAYEVEGYDDEAAGRDFWYTRNGHGCGFWDRGLGDIGDKLSERCGWSSRGTAHPYANVDAYYSDDGKVCLS
jgi:hypothetical protein